MACQRGAAADTAMLRLHDIIGRSGSLELLARRIDELAAESRRHPDNLLLATRTSYWRARYLFKVNRFGAACDTLRSAISRLDSATQSYDFSSCVPSSSEPRPTAPCVSVWLRRMSIISSVWAIRSRRPILFSRSV